MKNFCHLLFLFPLFAIAQPSKKAVHNKPVEVKPDGFVITGYVKGYPDSTDVSLLNPQTGALDAESRVIKNKFVLKGKMANTDFRVLWFNKQQPYIPLFLDNSNIKIVATKDSLDKAIITGSATQTDFQAFNNIILPYQNLFAEDPVYDSATVSNAMRALYDFAVQHKNNLVATLAIIRYNQIAEENSKTEELYNALSPEIKSSPYGQYISGQISDAKRNGVGTMLADFTQADTSGKPLSLSSLRGKYVLVDFWASWCHPCRMENPNVVAAYNKYKDKNFTVLSVSLDKAKPAWVDAIRMDSLSWNNHVSDLQGWSNAVALQFGITQIPQNILVGPNGVVIAKNLRGAALDRRLQRILK